MILVLSGTGDGRWLTVELTRLGYRVGIIVFSSYGEELAAEAGAVFVARGLPADRDDWLARIKVQVVVDARHPFARDNSTELARECEKLGILYLAVGREETCVRPGELVFTTYSMQEAAAKAASLGKTIFLTTGNHGLEHFTALQQSYDIRLVVRVLPEHRVIKKCQDMNIKPKDIVAMQGPFSKQINKALFKMYRASVVVTKDSGQAGGTDTKIEAALALKIPVVLVKRINTGGPELSLDAIVSMLKVKIPPE